jgi:hypothetical protein
MKHEDFRIGTEFWCGGRRWRQTDVGRRVVVGVLSRATPSWHGHGQGWGASQDDNNAEDRQRRILVGGPPDAMAEEVFDEHSIGAYSLARDGDSEKALRLWTS